MMEGLGRLFDVVSSAAGQSLSLKQAAGVTFVVTASAAAVITVNSQPSAGGSATACTCVTHYYTRTAANGTVAWADSGDTAASSTVSVATGSTVAFYVDGADLAAGSPYVEAVVTSGTATIIAILQDLEQQVDPKYLIVPGV